MSEEPRRSLSLDWEVEELHRAVEAARILLQQASEEGLQDAHSQRMAGPVAAAVLSLVGVRLRDLGRLIRGELEPGGMAAPHNQREAAGDDARHGFGDGTGVADTPS